jgi:TonB family protein
MQITRLGMKGPEPMMEESREAELPLTLEIGAVLGELGYKLDRGPLSQATLGKDADLRYDVDDLQKRFDSELQQILRKSKDVRKGRFTLGDEVGKLSLSRDVDALLFVRVRAQVLTNNKKAFGQFVAGSKNDTALMDFGIVDARTGHVLYFAKSNMLADIRQDSEETADSIKRAFRNLPPASPLSQDWQNSPSSTADISATEAVQAGKPPEPAASLTSSSAPDLGSQPRRLRVSLGVLKGMLIKKVPPEYPGIASANHIQGQVMLGVVIGTDGRVTELTVLSGPVQLRYAATHAVQQWRYRPFTLDGQAYEVETQVAINFAMGGPWDRQ